ncbi:hypothetical protein HYALB_00011010 [Hymenoscyphus albidus]|uniref:Uncharacterized protein n=1 Tax=Hymenoscyphus albidus TaxID=595503 RepID=A0A9N9LMP5_9HELO|nr:hypothetical protein HYALB_00011010 [Hymenoscyphus albidus]
MPMITELGPPEKLAKYTANISSIYGVSLLCGPILGGAISGNTSSRWVFLINVPAAVPAFLFTIFAIPKNFPYHGQRNRPQLTFKKLIGKENRSRLDIIGAVLLLLATLSLTAGFEEAESRFPWKSAYVITLLTMSGCLWIALLAWERRVTAQSKTVEPILPWRFMKNRVVIRLLLNSLFLGGPWFIGIFQLPQKFQLVHGTSALSAGIRLIPFTISAPIGSVVASTLCGNLKVPVIFALLNSACLQTLGFALLSTLPETSHIPPRMNGYQVIAGFGCGINISTLVLIVPFVVEFRDKAVGMGAVSQLRPMGGAIVLAITTSVFNNYTRPRLGELLGPLGYGSSNVPTGELLTHLPTDLREEARGILAHGYNLQMIILCAFAAAQIPATLLLWQKKPIRV